MNDPRDHHVPHLCHACGRQMDGMFNLNDDRGPEDGDITFCMACGCFGVWENDAERKPTTDEWLYIGRDPQLLMLQLQWMASRAG